MADLTQVKNYFWLMPLSDIYKFAFWVEFFNHVQQLIYDVHKPALPGALTRFGIIRESGDDPWTSFNQLYQSQGSRFGIPAAGSHRFLELPSRLVPAQFRKTLQTQPHRPQSGSNQNIVIVMEFCAKAQLTVTQVLGSITAKDVVLELNESEQQLVSVCAIKLKSFSDAFFFLFDNLTGQNGFCFTAIQEDSFWFFLSLLKLSLGFGIEDSEKKRHFLDQVFGFFDSLVKDANNFYGLVLRFIIYCEKQAPNSVSTTKEIFHRILAFDRFEEFYQLAKEYIQNDLETLFICFHQLFKGFSTSRIQLIKEKMNSEVGFSISQIEDYYFIFFTLYHSDKELIRRVFESPAQKKSFLSNQILFCFKILQTICQKPGETYVVSDGPKRHFKKPFLPNNLKNLSEFYANYSHQKHSFEIQCMAAKLAFFFEIINLRINDPK